MQTVEEMDYTIQNATQSKPEDIHKMMSSDTVLPLVRTSIATMAKLTSRPLLLRPPILLICRLYSGGVGFPCESRRFLSCSLSNTSTTVSPISPIMLRHSERQATVGKIATRDQDYSKSTQSHGRLGQEAGRQDGDGQVCQGHQEQEGQAR